MQRHAHADRSRLRPRFGIEALGGDGGGNRGGWIREGGLERISDRLELVPTMSTDSVAEDGVVPFKADHIVVASRSQRRVEPSMSVNRKVTIPEEVPGGNRCRG